MLIKQIIKAFILTTVLFSLVVLQESDTKSVNWFLFGLLITGISFGIPNAIFLLLIYWLKIGKDVF
jgi:hypothetical protein